MTRLILVLLLAAAVPLRAGTVELISRAASPDDTPAGHAGPFRFSADGRYAVFEATSPNLVAGVRDDNGTSDVFLFDRVGNTISLVSASGARPGRTSNGESRSSVISADGRFVAYQSTSTDLVPGQVDGNAATDIYLFDRTSGINTLVSRSLVSPSQAANAVSENATMSGDGRFVVFQSAASDLAPGLNVPPGTTNAFLWDRTAGSILLLSHADGSPSAGGNNASRFPNVSADGSAVVYFSYSSNLVAGQSGPNVGAVFAWDRASGVTTLVSHAAGSPTTPPNAGTDHQSVSADGRFVVLRSTATNLVSGMTAVPGSGNVFLHDRTLDTTSLVSHKAGSLLEGANDFSSFCAGSADGASVVFMSRSTDLIPGFVDANGPGAYDVFLYDRVSGAVSLVSRSAGSATSGANAESWISDASAGGRFVSFWTKASDVVAGQTGPAGIYNVFVFDRLSGTTRLVSHVPGSPAATANFHSTGASFGGDGSHILFGSAATDVVSGLVDNSGAYDLFLFDAADGSNALVTRRAVDEPSIAGNDYSTYAAGGTRAMSDDGRFILYLSQATNIVPGQIDGNGVTDLFLFDRRSRTSLLVSHSTASASTAGNGVSTGATISGDGRWVAFSSRAGDLVSGPDNAGRVDVFLYDRLAGATILVSRSAGTANPANGDSYGPLISRDGRYVEFVSSATDLVPGQTDTNVSADVFLYDRMADATTLVSHAAGSNLATGNGASWSGGISDDGAFVAFGSGATNLAGGMPGAFVFERATALVTFAGPADPPQGAALSGDGNWVSYVSSALNVVPGQVQGAPGTNVFLFDRRGGGTTLASHQAGSSTTTANNASRGGCLSSDGRILAFLSDATDLAAGVTDVNGRQDVFLFDRLDGGVRLVSAAATGTATSNGWSAGAAVSEDGNRIAFVSDATNIVPGQSAGGGFGNVFLYSRASGSSILVSGSFGSTTTGGNDDTYPPSVPVNMNASGDVLAFQSYASDLVLGDFNGTADFFVFSLRYEGAASSFHALSPCRVADTRGAAGTWGAPALAANSSRTLPLALRCGIPLDAQAVSANLTVVAPAADGTLAFYPAGFGAGGASTMNFRAGQTRANNAILGLGASGSTAIDLGSAGPAHLVVDVNGYFK